jgi:hypothetical protein
VFGGEKNVKPRTEALSKNKARARECCRSRWLATRFHAKSPKITRVSVASFEAKSHVFELSAKRILNPLAFFRSFLCQGFKLSSLRGTKAATSKNVALRTRRE